MQRFIAIQKFEADKQLAFGVVYAPDELDTHGDFMTAVEIEKMAYDFMMTGKVNAIDTQHDLEENGSKVVESFIARKGDLDFPEGSWVMGVKVFDEELWGAIKKGELTGFSMYGHAKRSPVTIEVQDE